VSREVGPEEKSVGPISLFRRSFWCAGLYQTLADSGRRACLQWCNGEMGIPPEARPAAELRDYLAEERTFLAWIRTGISLMGFGFVVARFGIFGDLSYMPLAAVRPANSRSGLGPRSLRSARS
jgi:hypothetical protein